jgi:hypothetical protein
MPSPRYAGRGRGPVDRQGDGEGEVGLRGVISSALHSNLTRFASLAPSPPASAGGEGWDR